MATDRWDGNVHYYDYEPDDLGREPNRDAFAVASAFIYSDDESAALGILVLVSGQELRSMLKAEAVARGRKTRDELVKGARPAARTLRQSRTDLFSLNGHPIP
jgi:hypothetical protein